MDDLLSTAVAAAMALGMGAPPAGVDPHTGRALSPASSVGSATPPSARPGARWAWPLSPRPALARAYEAPEQRWGRGHRGIDLRASPSSPVAAVAPGTVTHVGRIAGRGTVSVLHADGLRSTYEPVDAAVRRGDRVTVGQLIGRLGSEPGHCAPSTCLHVGALRGRDYLDPLPLFGRPRRVVLLPGSPSGQDRRGSPVGRAPFAP